MITSKMDVTYLLDMHGAPLHLPSYFLHLQCRASLAASSAFSRATEGEGLI